ncbi:transposase [Candidatus Uabimicrobium sp. HlEnr_7]|uniref:transposase n=1 Tax=Candidatus Uabimicrobium helgolandensis TaxID=3095367 RepID=UPI003558DCEF
MRAPRLIYVGGIYHVVARCNNRQHFFNNHEDFNLYLTMLNKARDKYNVNIHGFCATNNHIHLILGTPQNKYLSLFMQYAQSHFAKAYNKKYGKTGHFWAGRYHSTIIDSEEYYMNCLLYVELNMTRNGAKKHPKNWKYSSYKQHAYGKGTFQIDYHDQYLQLGSSPKQRQKKYRQIMQSAMQEKGLLKKQQPITYGIIYGSKQFIQNTIQKYANHKYYKKRKYHKTKEKEIYTLRKTHRDTS